MQVLPAFPTCYRLVSEINPCLALTEGRATPTRCPRQQNSSESRACSASPCPLAQPPGAFLVSQIISSPHSSQGLHYHLGSWRRQGRPAAKHNSLPVRGGRDARKRKSVGRLEADPLRNLGYNTLEAGLGLVCREGTPWALKQKKDMAKT